MIKIDLSFIKAFFPNEQLIMLQLLLHADKDGVVEFSDRGVSRLTGIPYQQVRTIHQKWLKDGTIINATANASINAKHVFVTICDYDSYNVFNTFSNAVNNAVTNALNEDLRKEKVSSHTTTIGISKEIEELKKENERLKEELTKVSKKKDDNSNYAELFEKFRLKYREYGGKVRGLETEFENLKKKHKDWKEIIPLLSDAIEKENSERKRARALGKFFHEMKNLQTYINQRSWEIYTEEDIHLDNENEYKPLSDDVMQRWNPARKCLEVNTPYLNMLNDGYTDDNRPDGATVAWQMYSWKWSTDRKEWVKQE